MNEQRTGQGSDSSIIFGENTAATGPVIKRVQDLNQRRYKGSNFSIDWDGENEESNELIGGYSRPADEQGGLFSQGNWNHKLPNGNGILPILKGVTGDRTPVSTALLNKTLLPAGTLLSKNVVSGENLAGAGDKRIIDTLGGISQAVNLRVTLASATLISAGTAGTVAITYDVGGTETTETRSFANSALTTAQNWTLPANAKVTKVKTTGFSAGTFQIEAIVSVIDDHDLTDASGTVADSLSTHPQAMVLILRPNASADLTAANTPATVVISYTVTGQTGTKTITKSFANAVKTTLQTAALPANATITALSFAGWSAGDMDIEAVFPLFDADFFSNTDKIALAVVKGATLSGSGAIAIADNLQAYSEALKLTVTPSENATTTGSNDATIVIAYTENGVARTGTLTFTNASPTTAQTLDLPADSIITGVTRSQWAANSTVDITVNIAANRVLGTADAWPGQLNFALAGLKIDTKANAKGKLSIQGLRKVGLKTSDVLRMNEGDVEVDATSNTVTVKSKKYFYEMVKCNLTDDEGVPHVIGTVTLTSETKGYSTVLNIANADPIEHTAEEEIGGVPRLIERMIFAQTTINNESEVSMEHNILAKRSDWHRTIEGGWVDQYESTIDKYDRLFAAKAAGSLTDVTTPDGTVLATNPFPALEDGFFPAIGGAIEIDGDVMEFDGAPITINHNQDFGTGKAGSLFRPATERQGFREVTTTVTAKYLVGTSDESKVIRWDQKYLNKETVNVTIYQYRWATDGRILAYIWELYNCSITAPVRPEATGPGDIPITIALRAAPPAGSTSELRVTLINDDQAA